MFDICECSLTYGEPVAMIQSHTLANGKVLCVPGNTVLAGYQVNVAACRNYLGMYGGKVAKTLFQYV